MAALGVGLASTVAPTMLVYAFTERESRAEDIGLFVGFTVGAVAGPAVGLWSGGRGDLAKRGLIGRSIGAGICLGAMGLASATWEESNQTSALTVTLAILSTVGGLMTVGSVLHDLSITPSATSHGKPVSVGLGVRSDGLLAVRVRF
jgi:predicted transporter